MRIMCLGKDKRVEDVQSSRVWTAFGWMALEASFWPANLGARAMAVVAVALGQAGLRVSMCLLPEVGTAELM